MQSASHPDSVFTETPDGINAPAPKYSVWHTTLRWLRREPMVHFVVAGTVIFLVSHALENSRANAEKIISIDNVLQQRLSKLYELQMGNAPSPTQLTQLTARYVHDEVLYREALALGLDKGDEIIRRRLVQKMGFLQNDLTILPAPDEATLHRYYEQHSAQFVEPTRISFQQLFFSTDAGNSDAAYRRATELRNRLNANADPIAANADRSPLAASYQHLDQGELERLFGATPIVARIVNGATGSWSGPVQSGYGWHLIKIDERREHQVLSFDAARENIIAAVSTQQKEENNRRNFQQLLSHYEIINTAGTTGP